MMYMPDAILCNNRINGSTGEKISVRTSYNLFFYEFFSGRNCAEIKKSIPDFELDYAPDYRQAIADSWPQSIDDSVARKDWGWKHEYDISKMTKDMLDNLRVLKNLAISATVFLSKSLRVVSRTCTMVSWRPAMPFVAVFTSFIKIQAHAG